MKDFIDMELENIYELMEKFRKSGLARLELREADKMIRMEMPRVRTVQQAAAPSAGSGVKAEGQADAGQAPSEEAEGSYIKSPIVGTFYAAPEENADPYVKVGDKVDKGSTVCIVEAMKMMNEINAPYDCVIEEVCRPNGSPVGYDDPLFRIREL